MLKSMVCNQNYTKHCHHVSNKVYSHSILHFLSEKVLSACTEDTSIIFRISAKIDRDFLDCFAGGGGGIE